MRVNKNHYNSPELGPFYHRGRVALSAILRALGIGHGDEVALQAFTCVAVPEGIMAVGAKPIWIDVENNGFNMDAADLQRKLTPKTRAIIVQHTYGMPADMESLLRVANKAGIPVIEDCCHTLVSTYRGKTVGTFGVGAFYSFEWGKPVVAGIGGAVTVNDPDLKQQTDKSYKKYRYPGVGSLARIQLQYYAFKILYRPLLYWPVRSLFHWLGSRGLAESNYNPVGMRNIAEDFQLRMVLALQRRLKNKLSQLATVTNHSKWVVKQYQEGIQSKSVVHPVLIKETETVFARYPLLVKNKRELLAAACKKNIELAEWYATPVHPLTEEDLPTVSYQTGSCPHAEERCSEVVTLPVHRVVSKRSVVRAIDFLNTVS